MTLRSTLDHETVSPLSNVPFEERTHTGNRPWLFTNMVASLDGAAAVDGLSGPMGDDDDREMFRALRASADAIIVGAATANAEAYRPPQRSAAVDAARSQTGRTERPTIAVISASLSIDPTLELFNDPTYRPLILTTDRANPAIVDELDDRADIVSLGSSSIDLAEAIRHLGESGHRTILSEGGPSLNGQLVASGLIDEWNLTLAPMLVGGSSPRPAHQRDAQPEGGVPPDYELARLWRGDRALFMRWIRPA